MSLSASKIRPEISEAAESPRMRHLYSKFRCRDSNPEGFDCKMNYWIHAINEWCIQNRQFIFTVSEIRRNFKHGTIFPDNDCLRLVFSEMNRRSHLAFKTDFINSISKNVGGGWVSWGFETLKKPLSLGFSLLSKQDSGKEPCEIIDESIGLDTEFINKEALAVCGKNLISLLEKNMMLGKTLRMEEFSSFLNTEWPIAPKQLDILIKYLENQGQAARAEEKERKYIKFGDQVEFTDFDLSLARLEYARVMLENDIDKTSEQMEGLREKSKEFLKSGNKMKAKNVLRQKKAMESMIEKKENQLGALNALIIQLHDAKSTKVVFDACKGYAGSVKSAMKAEDLDSVLADVEETLDHYNELKFDIARVAPAMDDSELESELKELMQEDEESDISLPQVPTERLDDLEARLERLRSPILGSKPESSKVLSE